MRLSSNRESIASGEVSLLAIIETLTAISLSVIIAIELSTLKWIAVSACVAPFLLLRTERSTALGIKVFDRIYDRLDPYAEPTMFVLLVTPAVRLIAVLVTAIRHPILTISSIPANWYRTAWCLDITHPPEILPGYEETGKQDLFKFSIEISYRKSAKAFYGRDDRGKHSWAFHLARLAVLSLVLVPTFLPALLYRWSLKATSLIYSSLIWLAYVSTRRMDDLPSMLRRHRKSDITRMTAVYSLIVVAVFTAKVALMMGWTEFAEWWNQSPATRILGIYVSPGEIPIWQLAAFVNALLTIALFLFAGAALLRMGDRDEWPASVVRAVLRVASVFRSTLTLYTVACSLYITIEAASEWSLPSLGTKLFPWQ